jgi:DNA-binding response OmpR family regulator
VAAIPILLVDDDLDLAEALGEALVLEGFELHTTSAIDEAITLVREILPCLILVDYQLPGVDTHELIGRLRHECAAPIVLCTGMGEAAALAEASGADDVLAKPFRIEQLVSLARSAQPAATP